VIRLIKTDLSGANLEEAGSLKNTDLRGVTGLKPEQLEACKARGAIIDGDATVSVTSAPVSIPTPDTWYWRAYSTHGGTVPAQVSTPPPDTGGSSTASSKPSNGSQAPLVSPAQESMPTSDTDGSNAAPSQHNQGA
jgi:hypothetical protein